MNISLLWKIVQYTWIASEILLLITIRSHKNSGPSKDRGSLAILWATISVSIAAAASIASAQGTTLTDSARWMLSVLLAVMIAGLVLRWIAIFSLGKAFTVNVAIHPTQTVYQSGVYRYIRHPSYTGMLISFTAVAVVMGNWISFAVLLVPIFAAVLYRIHVEEIALNAAFGEQYAEYSRRTKRLIPGIY